MSRRHGCSVSGVDPMLGSAQLIERGSAALRRHPFEQYIEHLESLIQLQLETIALRDGHYANVREQAERAAEYAQSLEAERARLEVEVAELRKKCARGSGLFRRR